MNPPPDQNDVSTALGLLRDSLAEEEQRIRNEGAKAMQDLFTDQMPFFDSQEFSSTRQVPCQSKYSVGRKVFL